MELKQRTELRKLLVPELKQSLRILSLPLFDLKAVVQEESENNPFLEEAPHPREKVKLTKDFPPTQQRSTSADPDLRFNLLTRRVSLQDILLRQLGMFANTDEEISIGQEIIGNIDENGYLKASLQDLSLALNVAEDKIEGVLKLIQQFEPAGIAARTPAECLLIQLKVTNEFDPLLKRIVEFHLEDVAKKSYNHIAKTLKEPLEKIEPLIKKILKLNPKPGCNYSTQEIQRIIPDVIIREKRNELEITINDEDIPSLKISETYKEMLKNNKLQPRDKEFLTQRLNSALAILKAISKRKFTLRKIVEAIVEAQPDAVRENLSHLKPLTFKDIAQKVKLHETTVCRGVMNKYVELPFGLVALKDFFSSHIHSHSGEAVSSTHIKKLIKELIEQEDKKRPLSDQNIARILSQEKNLKVSRRTVAKYRDELKILSLTFRKER